MLTVKSIAISNIKGIQYLTFEAGSLTILEGSNGTGKSSCLDSLRAVFAGGHDADLVRKGERKGEVILTLSDGTVIRKTITEKRSTLEVTTPDSPIPVPAPQTFVESLASSFAFDPLAILTIDAKRRAEWILQALPITFTPEEIAATGAPAPATAMDLDGLAAVHDLVYAKRKELNKSVRDSEGTIASLRQGLPAEDEGDWGAKWKALEEEAGDVASQIKDAEREAGEAYSNAAQALIESRDKAIEAIQEQIAELERQLRLKREHFEQQVSHARDERDAKLKKIADIAKPELHRLATEKAQAWERSQAQGKAAGARQTIQAMQDKVRVNSVESERLTMAIERLDALRTNKISTLPIDGIDFHNGQVLVNGIGIENLNTAAQVVLAIKLAKLRLGKLPLLIIDRAEVLDAKTWEAFKEAAGASGMQIVTARVTNDPALKVVAT